MSKKITVDFSRLKSFTTSPDAGDPDCLCSLCGKLIDEDDIPIRLVSQGGIEEYRLHWGCFLKVKK